MAKVAMRWIGRGVTVLDLLLGSIPAQPNESLGHVLDIRLGLVANFALIDDLFPKRCPDMLASHQNTVLLHE